MTLAEMKRKIESRTAVVGIIGLGYVGLPIACKFADVGFSVIGVDIKPERVSLINTGVSPIEGKEPGLSDLLAKVTGSGRLQATTEYAKLTGADVVLLDVETPVGEDHIPHFEALRAACTSLGGVLKDGALVVVESTVAPGTTDNIVRPLVEKVSGRKLNSGFYLGHCPERVMPGKLLLNLVNVSRVCGGSTPETAETMVELYATIVQADLDIADCLTAELVKTTENAYRDVNIAFANEVALICEAVGGDVWKVRELVNKSPSRQMHLPGAGVGGHCIPKDPWLLAYAANDKVPLRLIPAARAVNDKMPLHIARLTVDALNEAGVGIADARVAVLGYAYLENSDDTRNSPSKTLVGHLREMGAEVVIHDPWVPEHSGDLLDCVGGCDAAVIMVGHKEYHFLDMRTLEKVLRTPIIVDGRGIVNYSAAQAVSLIYRGVGQGVDHS